MFISKGDSRRTNLMNQAMLWMLRWWTAELPTLMVVRLPRETRGSRIVVWTGTAFVAAVKVLAVLLSSLGRVKMVKISHVER
jgi:hypothetical protein